MHSMKLNRNRNSVGFTLVELLVVIVIIAALAALSFTVGPKILRKAKATEAMQNLRQLGPVITTFATDHEMRLPPAKASAVQSDGVVADLQWNQVCLGMLFPDTKPSDLYSKGWWDGNKTIFKNPLFKGSTFLNPGYGMNLMIAENIATAAGGPVPTLDVLLATPVPLAAISEPHRTPLIAPFNNYYFRFDAAELNSLKTPPLSNLISDGKMPILFLDGHVELITSMEYTDRHLADIPMAP